MSRSCVAAAIAMTCCGLAAGQGARMLLTPARLHRLQRDRDRGTPRWTNFEQRVKTVADSPERGFELALYSVVASDEARGREAVEWAVAHRCERRQSALVVNWVRELATDQRRKQIASGACATGNGGPYTRLRDDFFWAVAFGEEDDFKPEPLRLTDVPSPDELYALVEYLDAFRTRQGQDLRNSSASYFKRLPDLFLLASRPELLDHPSWQAHVDALALVSLDPNLESSQFLQSWAMENRYLITEGPGVGYEFLWADVYLPGLGYENLQPWLYLDTQATLWARSSWAAGACWVHIGPGREESEHCAPGWSKTPLRFGRLTLVPIDKDCYEPAALERNEQVILHTAKPHARMAEMDGKSRRLAFSDAAGLMLVQANNEAAICLDKSGARGR